MPRTMIDLSGLTWHVTGYTPTAWTMGRTVGQALDVTPEFGPVPARVPGSVQQALRDAGLLPDWNVGLNAIACEWVENRDWVFSTELPEDMLPPDGGAAIQALGFDGFGEVLFNGASLGTFRNTFVPHRFELATVERRECNLLEIVFTTPPRFLGTPQRSSEIRDWKPRFNYTWDWMPRSVQLGIWDELFLELVDGPVLGDMHVAADLDMDSGHGALRVRAETTGTGATQARVVLTGHGTVVREQTVSLPTLAEGVAWRDLPVDPWWPNGEQRLPSAPAPLYEVTVTLLDGKGNDGDHQARRVGFKHVTWQACEGAPAKADPWLCVINGKPTFLQGVNWTPIRPYFADVAEADYRRLLTLYRDMGFNVMRVWGGAILEKERFYDLCDELGLLVWQEFPLSSSGPDNRPPDDAKTIDEMEAIGRSYVRRRRHHPSLLLWCGGNELQTADDGQPGCGKPLDLSHPMLARLARVCEVEDPGRRFLPTSSSGPTFFATRPEFGQGRHWDVHGPWRLPDEDFTAAEDYWKHDDALFRSETGAPGASPADMIRRYAGELPLLPAHKTAALWRRFAWWVDGEVFATVHGRDPASLEEYVTWSQERQARTLVMALQACKRRFPAIGGMIFWMGHDAFPCPANTSIVDFEGNPKPVATALQPVLHAAPATLQREEG